MRKRITNRFGEEKMAFKFLALLCKFKLFKVFLDDGSRVRVSCDGRDYIVWSFSPQNEANISLLQLDCQSLQFIFIFCIENDGTHLRFVDVRGRVEIAWLVTIFLSGAGMTRIPDRSNGCVNCLGNDAANWPRKVPTDDDILYD